MDKNMLSEMQKIRGTIISSDIEYYKLACLESISNSLTSLDHSLVSVSDRLREVTSALSKLSSKDLE
ncbi:hypothetical protein ES704_00632 [subsurface metagenome]|jgi:hypothetical protein